MPVIIFPPYKVNYNFSGTFAPSAYGLFPNFDGTVSKFIFATQAVSSGTSVGTNRYYSTSYGSTSAGYVFGGSNSGATAPTATVAKYTYTTSVVDAATSITPGGYHCVSVSNATVGIINQPNGGTFTANSTRSHTYSTNAIANATNLDNNISQRITYGCDDAGYFYGGTGSAVGTPIIKYIFSNSTISSLGSLAAVTQPNTANATAFGSSSFGLVYYQASSTLYQYDYASDILSTTTFLIGTSSTSTLRATGNDVIGIVDFSAGSSRRFMYASNTIASSTAISNTGAGAYCGATSGAHPGLQVSTFVSYLTNLPALIASGLGLFGETTAYKKLYNLANDAILTNGSMMLSTRQKYLGATAGNSAKAYMAGRATTGGSGLLAATDIYTYASDSFSVGTDLATATSHSGGTGNSTIGYICGGYTGPVINTIKKFTYSSNTQAISSATMSVASMHTAAAGNTTTAIIAVGYDAQLTSNIFTYSSETRTSGANLGTVGNFARGAFASPTVVMFAGGSASSQSQQVILFTISSNTAAAGSLLATGRGSQPASFGSQTAGYLASGGVASVAKYNWSSSVWSVTVSSGIDVGSGIAGGTSTVHSGL